MKPQSATDYPPKHWKGAIVAADRALAEPRPERSAFSRGEYGEDCYQLADSEWHARQRKALQLKAIAKRKLKAAGEAQ